MSALALLSGESVSRLNVMTVRFIRCSKRDSRIASSLYQLSVRRHVLGIGNRFRDWNRHDVRCLERHHLAALAIGKRAHGAGAKIRCQHPIESVGPAAAL